MPLKMHFFWIHNWNYETIKWWLWDSCKIKMRFMNHKLWTHFSVEIMTKKIDSPKCNGHQKHSMSVNVDLCLKCMANAKMSKDYVSKYISCQQKLSGDQKLGDSPSRYRHWKRETMPWGWMLSHSSQMQLTCLWWCGSTYPHRFWANTGDFCISQCDVVQLSGSTK